MNKKKSGVKAANKFFFLFHFNENITLKRGKNVGKHTYQSFTIRDFFELLNSINLHLIFMYQKLSMYFLFVSSIVYC